MKGPQVRLIECGEGGAACEVPVNQLEFLIGRGADCDLRLRNNSVSRHHCILRVASGEAVLIDLGSSNGTYLNNERVRSQAPLHSGDELRVGTCRFLVDLGDGDRERLKALAANPLVGTVKIPEPPASQPGK